MAQAFDYAAYAVELRKELHMYPEVGFDLPKTLALVRRELDSMGIEYTEKYGTSSIVGTINPKKTGFTIGIRADMDALPITEKSGCEFSSCHPGMMHACGHDVHTSILLATARRLQDMKDQIDCRVKLLFTPAEEYIRPGCKELAENGVTDDLDVITALHVNPTLPVGTVGIADGGQGANSMGVEVEFFGRASHAASQQKGVDAIAMAVQAYQAMDHLNAKEFDPTEPRLLNVGTIHGGNTNNIICDYCKMFVSARSFSDEVSDFMLKRIREIADSVAAQNGGTAKVTVTKFLPFVVNEPKAAAQMRRTAAKVVGAEKVLPVKRGLGGEDFGFLSRKKPSVFFRLGTKSGDSTGYPLHNAMFNVDDGCFRVGIDMFTQFVLDTMHGVEA